MLSYWKRSLPIRNTVLTIGIAILLRVGWHLIWGTPDSDILSIKSVFACLVLGWAIVDFWAPEWGAKAKQNTPEDLSK